MRTAQSDEKLHQPIEHQAQEGHHDCECDNEKNRMWKEVRMTRDGKAFHIKNWIFARGRSGEYDVCVNDIDLLLRIDLFCQLIALPNNLHSLDYESQRPDLKKTSAVNWIKTDRFHFLFRQGDNVLLKIGRRFDCKAMTIVFIVIGARIEKDLTIPRHGGPHLDRQMIPGKISVSIEIQERLTRYDGQGSGKNDGNL